MGIKQISVSALRLPARLLRIVMLFAWQVWGLPFGGTMKIAKWQVLMGCVVWGWMVLAGGAVKGQAETPPAKQIYPQIVRLNYVEGEVRLSRGQAGEKASGDEWEKAVVDVPIYDGFTLVTGAGGRAEIEFEDASHVYLDENSVLNFAVLNFSVLNANASIRHTGLDLVSGAMTIDAENSQPGSMGLTMVKTPANSFWFKTPWKTFVRVNSYLDGMELTPMADHTKFGTPMGELAFHAMHILRGNRHLTQKQIAADAVVRFRVVGRNAALIHPVELQLVPRHSSEKRLRGISKQLERSLRSRSTGDRDTRHTARRHGLLYALGKLAR
jgi:hypothetical protein